MRGLFLWALSLMVAVGCAPQMESSPTPTPAKSLFAQADEMLEAQDFEGAAVAFREVLDDLENSNADPERQRLAREKCTKALVEAGGFAGSQRLWEEMGQKNPESKMEAERMKARAERMMIMQAEELLVQASDDLKQGRRSKALATAQAAERLYEGAGAEVDQKARLDEFLGKLKSPEDHPREVEAE
jgi:tetratricopeptide (TPR) repeat protein